MPKKKTPLVSYALFEAKSGMPIGTLDSRETGSAASARKTMLQIAKEYERDHRTTVYVTESKLPTHFAVPVMETRVIYGKKSKKSQPHHGTLGRHVR